MQATPRFLSALTISAFALTACGGGGGGVTTPPTSGPGVIGNPTIACSATNTSPQSARNFAHLAQSQRRMVSQAHPLRYVPGTLEVVYHAGSGLHPQTFARDGVSAEQQELSFDRVGRSAAVLHVRPGTEEAVAAKLRQTAGVERVTQARYVYRESASPFLTNDPYYDPLGAGPPFYQNSSVEGQWDMHVMCLSRAWGYGENMGTVNAPGATGGNATIAVIDTGVDTTHPDLRAKIVNYSAVYDLGNGTKNTAESMHDPDGHGTDVAGIAAATTNNGYGFAGAGFNANVMPFKVFPDPTNSTATTTDVAAAINDAVAHHVNVINLSLGTTPSSGTCQSGGEDPVEAQAVANAVAAGVVVVASSGNETSGVLDCPGGDASVIAVGASALNDSGASSFEYVASYSNYDNSNSTWGVVAPGGDPASDTDADAYHWISNLWTSSAGSAYCVVDDYGEAGDCREEIAGTSMASPHVAGLAALLVSANSSLRPADVRNLICETADPISGSTMKQGCGRVDAYRAMAHALGDSTVQ